MKAVLCFFLLSLSAWSQATVYLRYGGVGSRKPVAAATNTNPVTLTVINHGFANGDLIWVDSLRGQPRVNGVRKVANVRGTSFDLYTINNLPVDGTKGSYEGSGHVGKVQPTALTPHPRIMLDGPGGALTARVKDPDGAGSGKAPAAAAGNPPWAALHTRYDSLVTSPQSQYLSVMSGDAIVHVAMGWYADNSLTSYLSAAKHWLNNIEKIISATSAVLPFFGTCDETLDFCGGDGPETDWGSFRTASAAVAYSFVRDQMTPAERQAFANKMLNGIMGEPCENRLQRGVGVVTLTSGSTIVTGTGTDFTTIPNPAGKLFHLRDGANYQGTWIKIASVQSATKLTLAEKPTSSESAKLQPWWWEDDWKPGYCGKLWWQNHHPYSPAVGVPEASTKLVEALNDELPSVILAGKISVAAGSSTVTGTSVNWTTVAAGDILRVGTDKTSYQITAISGNKLTLDRGYDGASSASITYRIYKSTTTIKVQNAAVFPVDPPFNVYLSPEWMTVTKVTGNTLTVTRGVWFSPPDPAAKNAVVYYTPVGTSGATTTTAAAVEPSFSPDYALPNQNLYMSRIYGMYMTALALADDDPRAARLLESVWNYWYNYIYEWEKTMWTGVNQGGYSYGPPRWGNWTFEMALSAKSSFSPAIDVTDGNWLKKSLLYPVMGQWPWDSQSAIMFGDSGSDPTWPSRYFRYLLIGNYLYAGSSEAAFGNYWYRSINNWFSAVNYGSAAGYNPIHTALIFGQDGAPCPGAACRDYRQDADSTQFFTDTDYNPSYNPGNSYSVVVSRQNWTLATTLVWMSAFGRPADHLGPYATPGTYRIAKNNQYLFASGDFALDADAVSQSSMVEVGSPTGIALPSSNRKNSLGSYGTLTSVDRKASGPGYAYWRVDSSNAFQPVATVTRHYRNFVHLKSANDYLVVHDDVASSTPQVKLRRLYCYTDDGRLTFSRAGSDVTCTRSQSKLSTKILLPPETTKYKDVTTTIKSGLKWTRDTTLNDGTTLESEFLVVHRASANPADAMPAVAVMSVISANATGAVIADPNLPLVVVLDGDGSSPNTNVTYTLSGLTQNAFQVVTGLAAGTYAVTKNGALVAGGVVVGPDGVLTISGHYNGSYSISQTSAATGAPRQSSGIAAASSAHAGSTAAKLHSGAGGLPTVSGTSAERIASRPQGGSADLTIYGSGFGTDSRVIVTGFNPTAVVAVTDSGEKQATAIGNFNIPVRVADTKSLRLGFGSPLPTAFSTVPYSVDLGRSVVNGAGPFSWSASELPGGFSLSPEGVLSSQDPRPGSYSITLTLTDLGRNTATSQIAGLTVYPAAAPPEGSAWLVIPQLLPEAISGSPYEFSAQVAGGGAPYSWLVASSAALPAGLNLNGGRVEGVPDASTVVGQEIPARYLSSDALEITLPASLLSTPGVLNLSVDTPGGRSNDAAVEIQGPEPGLRAVMNSASGLSGTVSPGEVVRIAGYGFTGGSEPPVVRFEAGGKSYNAALISASDSSLNVIVPTEVSESAWANVTVARGSLASLPIPVMILAGNPGIYTVGGEGAGQGAVLNLRGETTSPNSSADPAPLESTIRIFATGLGLKPGAAEVTIGGVAAEVIEVAPMAGISGVSQITVRVPGNTAAGAKVPLTVAIGGRHAQSGVTVALR